jgi:acyl carrier protein
MTDPTAALASFTAKVKQFVLDHKPDLKDAPIDETTDLIDSRIVDSLLFVEFLLFLEDHFGCQILVQSGDINAFRTIGGIHGNFYEKQGFVNV